jgi:hypothetical protein
VSSVAVCIAAAPFLNKETPMSTLHDRAHQLQELAEKASPRDRLRLQPKIDRVVATLAAEGNLVPLRLRRLNQALKEEAFDDMFDNMPV